MANLDNIVNDGFKFDGHGSQKADLAFVSLSLALQAYFSSYQTFKSHLSILDKNTHQDDVFFKYDYIHFMKKKRIDIKLEDVTQKNIDLMKKEDEKERKQKRIKFYQSNSSYREACFETIIHFQHFAELVCKQILRNESDLLVDKLPDTIEPLYKHIKGESLTIQEEEKRYSIELSEAIKRLDFLINKNYLVDSLNFNTHKETIVQLNKLRNRLWHRGLFILYYPALDALIGQYVLPFVKDILKIPEFSNTKLGKYQELSCSINLIDEIIIESQKPNPDQGKLAFLKELGRASYKIPLNKIPDTTSMQNNLKESDFKRMMTKKSDSFMNKSLTNINEETRKRVEYTAKIHTSKDMYSIKKCPVCGIDSLIVFHYDDFDDSTNQSYRINDEVKCVGCSFNIYKTDIKNASQYGFFNIDDYWL